MMSRTLLQLLFQLGCFALNLMLLAHGQDDQSGFISIDCGLPRVSSYTEMTTGIQYVSDANNFVDTGESNSISPGNKDTNTRPLLYLRSFPKGVRNCYKINVTRGIKYLIRASFLYGNYDGQDRLPQFELHLGPNLWDSVKLEKASTPTSMELIYVPLRNYVHVCLVNIGFGVPFISAIELRPLLAGSYDPAENGSYSLSAVWRYDTGQADASYRYPSDIHDRIWNPYYHENWTQLNTTSVISDDQKTYNLPSEVMRTAATPADSKYLNFSWLASDRRAKYYVYLHFAEVVKPQLPSLTRQLYFTTNADGQISTSPTVPRYLYAVTTVNTQAFVGEARYNFSILTTDVFFDPIINAIEIYMVKAFSESETSQEDVEAIAKVKSTYNITKNWIGDPCSPPVYLWEGLKCRYQDNQSPRIISLDLSSSGLTGEISPAFSNITMLQTLDLSNNNLTGSIPRSLSQLQNLNALKLEKNKLTGSVPVGLTDRRKSGLLSLSLCENPNLSGEFSCIKKKQSVVLLSIVGCLIFLFLVATAIWWRFFKAGPKGWFSKAEADKGPIFTRREIKRMTNKGSKIGEGGYGKVYRGTLPNGKQVAVKRLSRAAVPEDLDTFKKEAEILMKVRHRNIVSLIGYCDKDGSVALVYEYLPNGSLEDQLSYAPRRNPVDSSSSSPSQRLLNKNDSSSQQSNGQSDRVLPWKKRLQIAIDVAQGLYYLHNKCDETIVHRDIKPANILLSEDLQAKIGDFGISKVFATQKNTHAPTRILGTDGYIDPEYESNGSVTTKSDVYSFGILLLELITGFQKLVIPEELNGSQVTFQIADWVDKEFRDEHLEKIVDPYLQERKIGSVKKAIATALKCSLKKSVERLELADAIRDLDECMKIEVSEEPTPRD